MVSLAKSSTYDCDHELMIRKEPTRYFKESSSLIWRADRAKQVQEVTMKEEMVSVKLDIVGSIVVAALMRCTSTGFLFKPD